MAGRIVIPGELEKKPEPALDPRIWNLYFRELIRNYIERDKRRKVWELRDSMPRQKG